MSPISNPHKATIKRHLEESLGDGVQLDQIHRELLETFKLKGKYTLPQITAVTSWLRSEILGKKRVQEVIWDEKDGDTNEDVDFDNPVKNDSRAWHFGNIAKHTSLEQRHAMRLALLPGRNAYDIEAARNLEIQDLLTFIDGKDPKSVAEYIRNSRKYRTDRRVGEMHTLMPQENTRVNAAYLDYWGQFSDKYVDINSSIPIPPNYKSLCVGFNIMRGREHEKTQDALEHCYYDGDRTLEKLSQLFNLANTLFDNSKLKLLGESANSQRSQSEEPSLDELRNDFAAQALITSVGTNRIENWLLVDEIRKFMQVCDPGNNFDELSISQKRSRIDSVLRELENELAFLQPQLNRMGININMVSLIGGIGLAIVNVPFVQHFEDPKPYVSSHKNRPFVSYFGVLETKQQHNLQYAEAIKFFFDFASHYLPACREGKHAKGNVAHIGYFGCEGSGNKKEIIFRNKDNRVVAHINYNSLDEAAMGLIEVGRSILKAFHKKDVDLNQSIISNGDILTLTNRPKVGRNDPCHCGSGRKFKRCCMRC